MLTQSAADALVEGAEEFIRAAGLDLDAEQQAMLQVALRVDPDTGKWLKPQWMVQHPARDTELVAARVLIGFLALGERVLWTAQRRAVLLDPFERLCTCISRLGTPAGGLNQFDVDGVTVKVRRANGTESFERLDTGARVLFASRRYEAGRGVCADLAVVDEYRACTPGQLQELLPTLATCPNPQIVYV